MDEMEMAKTAKMSESELEIYLNRKRELIEEFNGNNMELSNSIRLLNNLFTKLTGEEILTEIGPTPSSQEAKLRGALSLLKASNCDLKIESENFRGFLVLLNKTIMELNKLI